MAAPVTATSPQSEVGLKERFFRYFQHEVTALQEQMARLDNTAYTGGERNDAVDHCLAGIDRLSHEVKDASSYIPAYDQRTYAQAIKALSEKLQNIRNTFNPPKKFQFKTRKNPSAISLSDAAELAQQNKLRVPGYYNSDTSNANSSFAPTPLDKLSPSEEKREQELLAQADGLDSKEDGEKVDGNTAAIHKPSFANASSVTISNHNGSHIILPTSASHAATSGTITNVRHCVVDLSPPTTNGAPFANIILKNIRNSLIVCGQVAGPIHITSVENSVIVVACRQFRMHTTKNVDVYLHCTSRPIIEDCEHVQFAPLPGAYITSDIESSHNQWDHIDDFKWLKAEPSPHYRLLPEADRVKEEVWKKTVPGGHSVSLDDILRAVTAL